jgi:hypothetical protein
MCGSIPVLHCADSRLRSSVTARGTSMRANPIATNAASQLHWWGYRSGAAEVIFPRSLRRNTCRAARCRAAASTVGAGRGRSKLVFGIDLLAYFQ